MRANIAAASVSRSPGRGPAVSCLSSGYSKVTKWVSLTCGACTFKSNVSPLRMFLSLWFHHCPGCIACECLKPVLRGAHFSCAGPTWCQSRARGSYSPGKVPYLRQTRSPPLLPHFSAGGCSVLPVSRAPSEGSSPYIVVDLLSPWEEVSSDVPLPSVPTLDHHMFSFALYPTVTSHRMDGHRCR